MSDFLGPLILLIFCALVSYWEYGKFGTFITPFSAITWPYTIITMMINFAGQFFGFYTVSLKSILFILFCLCAFLLGAKGIEWMRLVKDSAGIKISKPKNIAVLLEHYRPLFITVAVISIGAGITNFYLVIGEHGWLEIALRDFRLEYSTGILSHINNLSRPAFLFLFIDFLLNGKKKILLLLLLIFILILVRQVKYHIIVLLLGGLFLGYMNGLIRITLKKLLIYGLIAYFIFNLSYVIGFSVLGLSHAYSGEVQAFLFNHFFTYLFGGPIAFSLIIDSAAYPFYTWQEVVAVPINISRAVQGEHKMVDIIMNDWVDISNITKYFHSANIFGYFGMLWIYIGSLGTIAYTIIIGALSYLAFFNSHRENSGIVSQLVYAFIMSFLVLSFFGFYFNMLTFWEVLCMMLILPPIYDMYLELKKRLFEKHSILLANELSSKG